jgi:hypothetical protein
MIVSIETFCAMNSADDPLSSICETHAHNSAEFLAKSPTEYLSYVSTAIRSGHIFI